MTLDTKKIFDYVESKNSWYTEIDWTAVPTTLPVETMQLLWDTLIWHNQWLFLICMWWFWVFIENYLREKLIILQTPEDRSGNPLVLFKIIDEIEQGIEEWSYSDTNVNQLKSEIKNADWYKEMDPSKKQLVMKFTNTKWMFQYIVEELFKNSKIDEDFKNEIVKKYHSTRSAVQHWVYRRLYNEYKGLFLWRHENLPSKIDMVVVKWWPDNTEIYKGIMNSEQLLVRKEQFKQIAKLVCDDTLEIIHKLLSIFESDYK